jgi:phage tail-like protein
MPQQWYPFTAFNFEVKLVVPNANQHNLSLTLVEGEFAECDGLEMTMEPKKIREGGNNTTQINLVGPVSYGNLTLKRGMTPNFDLWRWFQLAMGGPTRGLRASGTVVMQDGEHKPLIAFELTDCLPLKLKGPSLNAKEGQVAIEELQLAYSTLVLRKP